MTGAVHVSVVALLGLVLDVCGGDGYTTSLFFGGLVDFVIGNEGTLVLEAGNLGDGCSQGGLAMVDVADGANVYVGLTADELFLAHVNVSLEMKKLILC